MCAGQKKWELTKYAILLKKDQDSDAVTVCGSVKAVALIDDSLCKNLVVVSMYNNKTVDSSSLMCESTE